MTGDESALLASILANPECDTVRLVYADWLDENGKPDRAEFIRFQINNHTTEVDVKYIRCVVAPVAAAFGISVKTSGRNPECLNPFRYFGTASGHYPGGISRNVDWRFHRGFLSEVRLSAADWLAHGDSLTWHPTATMECKRCGETGFILRGSYTGDSCPCRGTGRIPRPMPSTAQPITSVTLTTAHDPLGINQFQFWKKMEPGEPWRSHRWPGITFKFPETA